MTGLCTKVLGKVIIVIRTFKEIEDIVKKWSETELSDWYYNGYSGFVIVKGNPYESQIWNVISELKYVDNITALRLELAEDKDEDWDDLLIDFIEIRPKMLPEERDEKLKLFGIV